MKDNFSDKSDLYKQYRPEYPSELVDFVCTQVKNFDKAWDCATGNGQMARALSMRFKSVEATDISNQQLANAIRQPNINYSNQPAEATNFQDASFDLITVAQAIHWFDFNKFYTEAKRTLKPNGLIAVIGYGQPTVSKDVDDIIFHLYDTILGKYWDTERKFIDENYETIPFPFIEIECPKTSIDYIATAERFLGYLGTWSAIKHYMKRNTDNPIDLIKKDLINAWGEEVERVISWPILTRVGFKQ
jgi:SAM-dependent methyltransferase